MNTTNIITVTIIGLLAVMSPGPDFLIVTRNSLLYSKRVGLCTAIGITLGTMWWVTASLIGISLVISKTVILFNVIKWLGAGYLVYLGFKSLGAKRSDMTGKPRNEMGRENVQITAMSAFRMGLITNILNPKAAMFFVSFFSIVITPQTSVWIRSAYGLEISFIAFAWFSLLATVLSVSRIKSVFSRISVWLELVTGAILILLGFKLALTRSE